MKRSVIIVVSVVLVIALLAVWVYIMFFKNSNNDDEFTNLEFTNGQESIVIDNNTDDNNDDDEEEVLVDVSKKERLRQLTLKPTAGYQEVYNEESDTTNVYWVESGTGHIFSINMETGSETRVSNTTVPSTRKGVITPDGRFFFIKSGSGVSSKLTIGEMNPLTGTSSIIGSIDDLVSDFTSTTDNTFLYGERAAGSVIVKHYVPQTGKTSIMFTIPFREANIDWGKTSSDKHFFYPKASSKLEGFAYQAEGGKMIRLPFEGKGFSFKSNPWTSIYSKQVSKEYSTFLFNLKEEKSTQLLFSIVPEKCVSTNISTTTFICTGEIKDYDSNMPDSWYRGSVVFNDRIWKINTTTGVIDIVVSPTKVSGRELDIINMSIDPTDSHLYFINKNDLTLWTYEYTNSKIQN